MNATWISTWFWPALVLAFLLGVQLARWWLTRRGNADGRVNQEYFKGLNFLLNEEPDKAIEVFIKALEVDSETVELHLALGGLFRRKGQVDRATRIHQNLIARPSLTEDQRLQAIYELAQDYYKAGLLDRAEDLFNELKDAPSYRKPALQGLCEIYQQEKDWQQAIDVSKMHRRADRQEIPTRIAHYWCELASQAINAGDFEHAKRCLRNALAEDRSLGRAVLLRGKLHFMQQEYRRALDLWQSLAATQPALAALVIEPIIDCYNHLQNQQGLQDYLLEMVHIPREAQAFEAWYQALIRLLGEESAQRHLFKRIAEEGLSAAAAQYLHRLSAEETPDNEYQASGLQSQLLDLVQDLLVKAKQSRLTYSCQRCGFATRSHYWLCPNCSEWDSFVV